MLETTFQSFFFSKFSGGSPPPPSPNGSHLRPSQILPRQCLQSGYGPKWLVIVAPLRLEKPLQKPWTINVAQRWIKQDRDQEKDKNRIKVKKTTAKSDQTTWKMVRYKIFRPANTSLHHVKWLNLTSESSILLKKKVARSQLEEKNTRNSNPASPEFTPHRVNYVYLFSVVRQNFPSVRSLLDGSSSKKKNTTSDTS